MNWTTKNKSCLCVATSAVSAVTNSTVVVVSGAAVKGEKEVRGEGQMESKLSYFVCTVFILLAML
jgi:hypothetical protein